jgi:3-hydroxyacyl-[acyl-carrier-protein] dehydratase
MLRVEDIVNILPHRAPMLWVDGVGALKRGVSLVAYKHVNGTEFCFPQRSAHQGSRRVPLPCSLLIESFGQASALLWLYSFPPVDDEQVLLLTSVANISFEAEVFPGDTMEHRVVFERKIGENAIMSGETRVGRQRIAHIERIMLSLRQGF